LPLIPGHSLRNKRRGWYFAAYPPRHEVLSCLQTRPATGEQVMFVFNPLTQGLELLAQRELQKAEHLFLQVINDPYSQSEELSQARHLLKDIRSCENGYQTLDFERYHKLALSTTVSLDKVTGMLRDVYFLPVRGYEEIGQTLAEKIPEVINRLKQVKIRDILARDEFLAQMENEAVACIQDRIREMSAAREGNASPMDGFRWKTIFRKFVEQVNPVLLERHLELLDYILETGEMALLDDPKLSVMTPKYQWILESTVKIRWYLLRSYFFKARSEIQDQFKKKEGTRKHWEELKYKKIKIFESCGFSEANIQKFLYIDKLNYKTLEEIHRFAESFGLKLIPRDVSLALRGVDKARDHIKERGGFLMGERKKFQDRLVKLGFSEDNAYQIARQAKKTNNHQIAQAFSQSLKVAQEEIYWYRIPAASESLRLNVEAQCIKHLSTVRIHLFERGRLNKLLLLEGKPLIRQYLIRVYGEGVVSLHCYFRLETVHQYYKLKYFQYHAEQMPSVSELIKISRRDFQPRILEGYQSLLKKKRLVIPPELYQEIAKHRSQTGWEDACTLPEEKILLKFWFLMDHGVPITQRVIDNGLLRPGVDLWDQVKGQSLACKS